MDESDLLIIERYVREFVFEPKFANDVSLFKAQSYCCWAAGEILSRVADNVFRPPPCVDGGMPRDVIDIIEEFAFEMDYYSDTSKNNDDKDMFVIARETAEDVLHFYIQERRKKNEQDQRWRDIWKLNGNVKTSQSRDHDRNRNRRHDHDDSACSTGNS